MTIDPGRSAQRGRRSAQDRRICGSVVRLGALPREHSGHPQDDHCQYAGHDRQREHRSTHVTRRSSKPAAPVCLRRCRRRDDRCGEVSQRLRARRASGVGVADRVQTADRLPRPGRTRSCFLSSKSRRPRARVGIRVHRDACPRAPQSPESARSWQHARAAPRLLRDLEMRRSRLAAAGGPRCRRIRAALREQPSTAATSLALSPSQASKASTSRSPSARDPNAAASSATHPKGLRARPGPPDRRAGIGWS